MPSILLDLTDQEYNSIPGKKRTWVRELVRAGIQHHLNGENVSAVIMNPPLIKNTTTSIYADPETVGELVHKGEITPAEGVQILSEKPALPTVPPGNLTRSQKYVPRETKIITADEMSPEVIHDEVVNNKNPLDI